jgi:branched-chain amino acid transport system permease protein
MTRLLTTARAAQRRLSLPVVLCVVVAVATLLGSSFGPRLERATGTALIMLILVVGLKVFIGDSGIFSFGQVAFMGIGAYTTAITTMSTRQKKFQLPALPHQLATLQLQGWEAALLSGFVAAAVASVISIPLVRLSGLTASLASVAILITFHSVFENWTTYTRGSSGIILDSDQPRLLVLFGWACAAIFGAVVLRQSPIGLRLAASREDEVAAKAVGIRVWWERGVAFIVSCFIVGVGGSLFAQYFGSLNPESFYLTITFTGIAMLVVGGLTSVSGAVFGTLVISIALELLRAVERGVSIGSLEIPSRAGLSEVGLALVLLLVLLLRPAGLTGGRELSVGLLTGLRIRGWPVKRAALTAETGAGAEPADIPGDRVSDADASPTGGRPAR